MSLPDWIEPVARCMLEEGLANTLKVSAIALVGSSPSASRSARR